MTEATGPFLMLKSTFYLVEFWAVFSCNDPRADVAATVYVADATDENQRGDSEQFESRETRDGCVSPVCVWPQWGVIFVNMGCSPFSPSIELFLLGDIMRYRKKWTIFHSYWLVVWNMNFMTFQSYWKFHHPNWRSLSFFRGVGSTTNQYIYPN